MKTPKPFYKRATTFILRLEPHDHKALIRIARRRKTTASDILRDWIKDFLAEQLTPPAI